MAGANRQIVWATRPGSLSKPSDPLLADQVAEHVWVGAAFVLADVARFQEVPRQWMLDTYGLHPNTGCTIPRFGNQPVELPGMRVLPVALPSLTLASITSDKSLYRAGRDVIHLLVLDMLAVQEEKTLLIRSGSVEFSKRVVRLNEQGMVSVSLRELPPGDYAVFWSDGADDEPACEFTVAEYTLAPLVATLVRRSADHETSRLLVILSLRTFGVPVQGCVRLEMTDAGRPVASATVEACQGAACASFPLSGEGPHAINVQMVDSPSRTATVPIPGSRRKDRQPTVFSRLGGLVTGSQIPGPASREVRGLYLDEEGGEASPMELERVDARLVCLRATVAVEAVAVQLIDVLSTSDAAKRVATVIARRDTMAPGETITVEASGSLGLVAVAAFVEGKPWEGWATVVSPSRLVPKIHLPERMVPGAEVAIEIETGAECGSVYLVVKDARFASPDTPAARLAGQIKQGADRVLTSMGSRPPVEAWRLQDYAQILVHEGAITHSQLLEAQEEAKKGQAHLADILIKGGYTGKEEVFRAIGTYCDLVGVDFSELQLPRAILCLVPEFIARENLVLPLGELEGEMFVATSHPDDLDTIDTLRFLFDRNVRTMPVPEEQLRAAIDRLYGPIAEEPAYLLAAALSVDTSIDFCESLDPAGMDRLSSRMPPDLPAEIECLGQQAAPSQSPPCPADETEVLFADLVQIVGGRAVHAVRLGSGLNEYSVEAFVVGGTPNAIDWSTVEKRFQVDKDPYVELQLPRFVASGDGAQARVHFGAASSRIRVRVSRDGGDVVLNGDGEEMCKDEVLELRRGEMTFLAIPGEYIATVEDVVSGATDRVVGCVEMPGRIRRLAKPVRILEPGESLRRDNDPHLLSLRVLPGLDQPFQGLIEATGGYNHHCCEQTAAKILAAAAMYITSGGDFGRRARAEEMILAGIRREAKMWLPGLGFKIYPEAADAPDGYCGPIAARHLHYLELLRETGDELSEPLCEALAEAVKMGRNAAQAYHLDWPPKNPKCAEDAYAIVRFSPDIRSWQNAVAWGRQWAAKADSSPCGAGCLPGAVGERIEAAYAAAALLRGGDSSDLVTSVGLANKVISNLGPEGRLYSTVDSVAAIAMLSESKLAGIMEGNQSLRINGREMSLAEAAKLDEDPLVVEALTGRVAVQMTRLAEEDWSALSGDVPLRITLEKNGRPAASLGVAETLELLVALPDGYHAGDLVCVCLPDSLAWVSGGGQIRQFEVDFQGRDFVRVPLVTTGPTLRSDGQPGPHHFAACLRNMFEEERAGNVGALEIVVSERFDGDVPDNKVSGKGTGKR